MRDQSNTWLADVLINSQGICKNGTHAEVLMQFFLNHLKELRHHHDMFYLEDNDRAARVLFVQHSREQGEWCSQNPSVVRVLT